MIKILYLSLPIILYIGISISCGPRNPSQSQKLLGKWNINQVMESGNDVSEQHNPSKNRWIKFHTNQRFDSDGDPYGKNSGNWSVDEENVLFLDSDNGEEDDSYWKIDLENKSMTWKEINNDFARNFEINFIKN